jgi:Erv1 / Alr family
MPAPEVWGPATWTLFHVLAENVNEFAYPRIVGQIFDVIKRVCSALPCPECAQDATIFLSKVRLHELRTKNDFKNMIYMFHNYVNAKKRKPLFNYANLEIYKRYNIVSVFNRFISVYHTKGNMRLLAESFQRQIIIRNIREWFSRNICFFIPRQQASGGIQEPLVSEEVPGVVSEAIVEAPISETTVVQEEEPNSSEVKSEAVEPEAVISEAIEPEIVPEPEIVVEPEVAPIEEVVAPEEVISEAIEPEVISKAIEPEEVISEAIEPEVSSELSPELAPESEVIQEETAPEEVKSEEESELVESEATVTVVESEPVLSEEPVKPKRGRKKKVV